MTDPGPGQVLFAFVRHWSRRSESGVADQGSLVLVTEAVYTLAQQDIAATVNTVAHEIGIDQSGASRLIKAATEAGYLVTQVSDEDARRRQARVTQSGHEMLVHAHSWQEETFARLTEGWSEQRRRAVQQAMSDLLRQSSALD